MTDLIQNVQPPEVRDPNSICEVLANGPINMNVSGNFVTLTFTQNRPDVGKLFKGKVENLTSIVVSRVTLPIDCLVSFKDMLDRAIQMPTLPGSQLKQ